MSKTPSKIRRLIQQAAEATSRENLPPFSDTASRTERAAAAGVSLRTQSKLDYLARRRRLDLLEQIQTGTLSVDGAYRLAGGGPNKTLLEQVQRLWQKATPEERRELAAWIQAQSRLSGPDPQS